MPCFQKAHVTFIRIITKEKIIRMLLFLSQILSYLMTGLVSTSLLMKPFNFLYRLLIGMLLLVLCLLFGNTWGQFITPVFLICSLSFISINNNNRLWDIILFQLGWLWFVLTDYVISIPMGLLGYSAFEIQTTGYLCFIYVVLHSIVSYVPAFLIAPLFRKKYYPLFLSIPQKAQFLLCVDLTICSSIYIFNIIYGSLHNYNNGTLFFNAFLFFLYFFSNIMLFYLLYRIMLENQKLNLEKAEQETLKEYTSNLEYLYQNIRSFKHDYKNVLSTLKFYIDEADAIMLKEYFHDKIIPLSDSLNSQHYILENLYRIKVLEIKGILYAKLTNAINLGLFISFEVPDAITEIYVDSISICKILGILLDNAIEAATLSLTKTLKIALISTPNFLFIHIENSTLPITVPIEVLSQDKYTTKPAPHCGLGLHKVKEIITSYPNICLSTQYDNNTFIQRLEITK